MSVIALVFDFDDTLMPDSTSALLEAHGIDTSEFWQRDARELVDRGFDPPLAYLNLLLDEVRPDGRLAGLTNQRLAEFGASLDDKWFAGLPQFFDDARALVSEFRDVDIEFYIVSGGLQALISGSSIVNEYFEASYGCQLAEDPESGVVSQVSRCVTFTEKTRFLFEINKGIAATDAQTKPHLVNQAVEAERRRVPFKQMIYVGDGLTDVPCFSLVQNNGGNSFAIFQRDGESAKQAFQQFMATDRVRGSYSPNYSEDADLGSMLRAAVATVAGNIQLEGERALGR
jgi:phosphoserine phosphatase